MKTFGLYIILFFSMLLITFINLRGNSVEELIKINISITFAYILYKLIKEETK
jgi:hypothetical protein